MTGVSSVYTMFGTAVDIHYPLVGTIFRRQTDPAWVYSPVFSTDIPKSAAISVASVSVPGGCRHSRRRSDNVWKRRSRRAELPSGARPLTRDRGLLGVQTAAGLLILLAERLSDRPEDRLLTCQVLAKAEERALAGNDLIGLHFTYHQTIRLHLRWKGEFRDASDLAFAACHKQMRLSPQAAEAFRKSYPDKALPTHLGYLHAAGILEQQDGIRTGHRDLQAGSGRGLERQLALAHSEDGQAAVRAVPRLSIHFILRNGSRLGEAGAFGPTSAGTYASGSVASQRCAGPRAFCQPEIRSLLIAIVPYPTVEGIDGSSNANSGPEFQSAAAGVVGSGRQSLVPRRRISRCIRRNHGPRVF